jgi:hypothetical protein
VKSIHCDEKGKYPVAVYDCVIFGRIEEDEITQLFPRAYGHNVTAYGYTYVNGETRWQMLIANTVQTTVRDITVRIETKYSFRYNVSVIASVAYIGKAASRSSSPRWGTERKVLNTPHGKVVSAK